MSRERTRGNCKYCGNSFETWQGNRLYCNESCRRNFHRVSEGKKPENEPNCDKTGICKVCGKNFPLTRDWRLYCSSKCRSNNIKSVRSNPNLSFGSVGALRELIACVDLMNHGYEVFRALSPNSSCDLVVIKEGKIWRVEVTTGYIRKDGSVAWVKHDESKYDVLAAVMPDSSIVYIPESLNFN